MEKKFFATLLALSLFAVSTAKELCGPIDPPGLDYLVTDCGTVHQIPHGLSDEAILRLLDYYTSIDCQ